MFSELLGLLWCGLDPDPASCFSGGVPDQGLEARAWMAASILSRTSPSHLSDPRASCRAFRQRAALGVFRAEIRTTCISMLDIDTRAAVVSITGTRPSGFRDLRK